MTSSKKLTWIATVAVVVATLVIVNWPQSAERIDVDVVTPRDTIATEAAEFVDGVAREVPVDDGTSTAPDIAPMTEPSTTSLRVRVVHADEEPARGVIVVLAEGTTPFDRGVTDTTGAAVFEGRDEPATVYVGGASFGIDSLELEACHGEAVVRVAGSRAEVSGVVLLDGAPATIPLGLRAMGDVTHVPWNIRAALKLDQTGIARSTIDLGQHTDTEGAFRFADIPADWNGHFSFGLAYALAGELDGWARPEVAAGDRNVVLDLRRIPVLRGTVVLPDGVTPAVHAAVTARIEHRDSSVGMTWFADEAGRFAMPMADGPVVGFAGTVEAASGDARATFEVGEVSDALDHDLGVITLRETRSVTLRVIDDEGNPVRGALANMTSSDTVSHPTNNDGDTVIEGMSGTPITGIEVWAHPFAMATVDIPAPLPTTPFPVTLTRCATVEVVAVGESRGCSVRLALRGPPSARYVTSYLRQRVIREATGIKPNRGGSTNRQTSPSGVQVLRHLPFEQGRAIFSCIPHDTTVEVEVFDHTGSMVWTSGTTALRRGEQRRLDVIVPEPGVLRGRILDSDGLPVSGARISLRASPSGGALPLAGQQTAAANSDAEGRFELDDLRAPTITAVVKRMGFVRREITDVPRPAGEWLVTLETARMVDVVFVNASGSFEPVTWLQAVDGDTRLQCDVTRSNTLPTADSPQSARRARDAHWTARDLPRRDVELQVRRTDGTTHRVSAPLGEGELRVTLPATGTIEITFEPPHTAVTLSAQIDGEQTPRRISADDTGRGLLECVAVGTRTITLQERRNDAPRDAPWTRLAELRVDVSPGAAHTVEF